MTKQELMLELYRIGVIKLGQFTLKSGQTSSVYVDLRRIISFPTILRSVADLMLESVKNASFDLICGIPYTALPIATSMSLSSHIPMVMRRKEKKDYGTKQMIEGVFQPQQTCLLVEDVITTGGSVLETAKDIQEAGLQIHDVVVLIDREQGGRDNLLAKNFRVHAVMTLSDIFRELLQTNIVSHEEQVLLRQLLKEPI